MSSKPQRPSLKGISLPDGKWISLREAVDRLAQRLEDLQKSYQPTDRPNTKPIFGAPPKHHNPNNIPHDKLGRLEERIQQIEMELIIRISQLREMETELGYGAAEIDNLIDADTKEYYLDQAETIIVRALEGEILTAHSRPKGTSKAIPNWIWEEAHELGTLSFDKSQIVDASDGDDYPRIRLPTAEFQRFLLRIGTNDVEELDADNKVRRAAPEPKSAGRPSANYDALTEILEELAATDAEFHSYSAMHMVEIATDEYRYRYNMEPPKPDTVRRKLRKTIEALKRKNAGKNARKKAGTTSHDK